MSALPSDCPEETLGLDPSRWRVTVNYSKGFLSHSRYMTVTVTHLPSGRNLEHGFYAAGKATARREAAKAVMRLVSELRS